MEHNRDNLPENVILISNPVLIPVYTHRLIVQTNDFYHNNIKIYTNWDEEVKSKVFTFDSQKITQKLLLKKLVESINWNFDNCCYDKSIYSNCSMYLYEYIYDYRYEDFDDFGSHWLDNICFYKMYQLFLPEEVVDNNSLTIYFILKGLTDIE